MRGWFSACSKRSQDAPSWALSAWVGRAPFTTGPPWAASDFGTDDMATPPQGQEALPENSLIESRFAA